MGEVQHFCYKGGSSKQTIQALAAADGTIDEAAANETTETLNRINNRATLVDDLKSCATESGRQISVSYTIIRIR